MEKILLLVHDAGNAALEAATAAEQLGGELTIGMVGADNLLTGCKAARFLAVTGEAFTQSRSATDCAAAEALIQASGANIVIAPHTPRWHRALTLAAEGLGAEIDTHIVGLKQDGGKILASRYAYRQRIETTFTRAARPWILLVDGGIAPACTCGAAAVTVEQVSVAAPAPRTTVTGIEATAAGEQTIRPDAPLLFVAGAGWTKKQKDGQTHVPEAGELILGLLHATPSSLGSSKSLVDLGGEGEAVLPFLTHLHQVGQTGATPRHPKGLATCCHGEEPHVVGWRFVRERRAVNLDPNCGWARGKADVLYVADAFEVMRELNGILRG